MMYEEWNCCFTSHAWSVALYCKEVEAIFVRVLPSFIHMLLLDERGFSAGPNCQVLDVDASHWCRLHNACGEFYFSNVNRIRWRLLAAASRRVWRRWWTLAFFSIWLIIIRCGSVLLVNISIMYRINTTRKVLNEIVPACNIHVNY